jgi:hypothetical protein
MTKRADDRIFAHPPDRIVIAEDCSLSTRPDRTRQESWLFHFEIESVFRHHQVANDTIFYLRRIIFIGPDVVLVCRWKFDGSFGIVLESPPGGHLQIQLELPLAVCLTFGVPAPVTYLVILVQLIELALLHRISHSLIAETDSVIEITKPHDAIMVVNRAIFLKPKAVADCGVIFISLIVVPKARRQMCRHET